MREKKFGKLFLTWLLAATMVLTLLPVGMLAADAPDEAAEDGEAVLTPVAGAEAEEAAPVEAAPMLLAAPAAENAPTAVPAEKLIFDKGVIKGIDKDWLAANKDQPLSVTIPAEIGGTPVTSIGQYAFNREKVVAVDFSDAINLETIDKQAFMHSPVASVDLSKTKVKTIGKFAFGDCTSLETFIFPDKLTSLGNSDEDGASVFTDCKSLKVMRLADSPEGVVFALPETLKYIGKHTFKNCFADGVEAKVVIPASVETLGEGAFYDKHITQIIINKKCDVWDGESVYDSSAIRIPDGTNCMIIFPDKSTYDSFEGYTSTERNAMTYPVKVKFFIYGWQSEYHLNDRLLGYQQDNTTGFWEFDDNYALPEAPASSAEQKPGYDYISGWSGTDGAYKAFTLQNDKPLHVTPRTDGSVSVKSGQGTYVLQNPTISYLVDGKTEKVGANQPFTVTIGDGKKHSIGIQVDHPLLKEKQGTDKDYVYFEYYWFDEVALGDGQNTMNGPRSKKEPERFSTATSNVEIQYVDGEHNTIPIAKTEDARYEGSSYAGYNDYYLVVVFGYHVVNGDKINTPFYLSANNGIGTGYAGATDGVHLLQVKVNEVRIITATADANGTIDPSGEVAVPKGENQTFKITPNEGYHINDVLVDGKSVGAVTEYKFENVTEAHKIHATFARNYTPSYPIQPEQPKVEIPDEDALGLNTTDHFAYIVGYPDGTVQPNGQITRAEATTIFFRLLTEESRSANLTKTNGYTDVASDAWYNTAVSTMTKAGIVDGYPDGTFRPDAPITRAEMAKIISLFAKLDKSESRFSDIAGHWAEAYIRLAAGNGWIAGYPDGTFGPQRNITRAETATMINRVLDRVPSEESHLLSRGVMQIWPDANPGDWFYLAMQEATNSHDYERNAKWAAADEQWTALRETRDWKALEQ